MTQPEEPPSKTKGIAHFFAAARYSLAGGKRLWSEAAFRHEVLAAGLVLFLFALIGAAPVCFVVVVILALLTFAVEALNSAIEEVVDHISPEWSKAAKHAKDMGSFAVMCLLIANGVFAGFVLVTTLFQAG